MRVVLMHNPSAGGEDHSADRLMDDIRRAGHDLVGHVTRRKDLRRAIRARCDLVAAAGGDGTVGKVATVLKDTGIPLAVLPLGTANNVARTLRLTGTTTEQIAAWKYAAITGFDVAVATFRRGAVIFIEGLGFGAFPHVMRRALRAGDPQDPAATLARDIQLLRQRIHRAPARPYDICADGRDLSGSYFLVELLNIPCLGPNVCLAPCASPADGKLDVVVAGEAERDTLLRDLDRLARGEEVTFSVPTYQAAEVSIRARMRRHHRDGDLAEDPLTRLDAVVDRHALQVLSAR